MAAKRSNKGNKVGNSSRDKRKATTQPVGNVSELLTFWDRGFDLSDGYQGLVVEVIARENNVIAFYLLDRDGNTQRKGGEDPFTINLDDGLEAWSSLPSTAQDIDPESSQRIGYLFVTGQWLARNRVDPVVMGGPGKWPRTVAI